MTDQPTHPTPDLSRSTYALALVGDGISGSLTPAMHEAEGIAQGLGITYRRVELADVGVERLPEVVAWARAFGLDGYNVTHPVKQAVIPLLDDLSELARRIGAVNTVVVGPDGRLTGHNTDALGFARMLRTTLPQAFGGPVVQLGAGGAGSATAHALLAGGVPHLTVVDVDLDRRETLRAALAASYGEERVAAAADPAGPLAQAAGLVNATPVGMDHHPGSPVDLGLLRPDLWVADIIYSPISTELVTAARALGCPVANGGGMAVYQAVEAFELFTGRPADPARMAATFESMLAVRGY